MCQQRQERTRLQASKHGCKQCSIENTLKNALQMCYEEGNAFDMFVRAQGFIQ